LLVASGKWLRELGMPGQKEWQEMEFIPREQRSESRLARILLKHTVVRFKPLGKQKTGRLGNPVGPSAVWTRDFGARVQDSS
jgi:hypothetical protein